MRRRPPKRGIMDDKILKMRESHGRFDWTYEHIRPYLQIGDQVLFKGKGIISDLICFLSGGDKSHIGTVIKSEIGPIMLLESDYGKNIHGLQLSMLGEKIKAYKGDVFVRFLNCPRSVEWYAKLLTYIDEHRGTSYEKGIGGVIELLRARFGINKTNERNLFCSEASAGIFKNWGFLPAMVASNDYTPEDFDEGKKVDDYLREASLLSCRRKEDKQGIWLSPCQKIVRK
jgi:hypothetical protein